MGCSLKKKGERGLVKVRRMGAFTVGAMPLRFQPTWAYAIGFFFTNMPLRFTCCHNNIHGHTSGLGPSICLDLRCDS